MFNRFIAILLIVCVQSANFSRLFIFAGFELNRNYIAKNLCENRNRPWLHCNGKCFLMKKLKQALEKEKSEERESAKNLFQEGIIPQKAMVKFCAPLLAVMPVPYHPNVPRKSFSLPK